MNYRAKVALFLFGITLAFVAIGAWLNEVFREDELPKWGENAISSAALIYAFYVIVSIKEIIKPSVQK